MGLFARGVRKGRQDHADEQQKHRDHLVRRVVLPPVQAAHGHGGHGPRRPQDDVQGDADAVLERHVVEDVDAEEVGRVDEPFAQRDRPGSEVGVAPAAREGQVPGERREGDEEELERRDQGTRGGRGLDQGLQGVDVGAAAAEDEDERRRPDGEEDRDGLVGRRRAAGCGCGCGCERLTRLGSCLFFRRRGNCCKGKVTSIVAVWML